MQTASAAWRMRVLEDQARWKPDPETWSVLEGHRPPPGRGTGGFSRPAGNHLERFLRKPGLPSTRRAGWLPEEYNRRDLASTLNDFLVEREKSLSWLSGLDNPDWEAVYQARFGPIRAGDMFAAWAAHDLLHLRQLVELHWAYLI
jgi:hypothetical protein